MKKRPLIGLSADFVDNYARLRRTYLDMVEAAGGIPVILPPKAALREEMLDRVDGVIMTGGDDRIRPADHFDPRLLSIFARRHAEFDAIWTRFGDGTAAAATQAIVPPPASTGP